ncbi:MAG: hypothetical protein LBF12_04965 [Christensenellaceae bacterium]|nr:hypothetical protein [Christensenellaceae bacterium]
MSTIFCRESHKFLKTNAVSPFSCLKFIILSKTSSMKYRSPNKSEEKEEIYNPIKTGILDGNDECSQ